MASTNETIIVSYDGEWKKAQDLWNWVEKRERSKGILVKDQKAFWLKPTQRTKIW